MRQGFTLIELSIVLVIIGLLVGGVLVGQNLINAAAMRAQITQIEKYNTAVNTFRGKYGYLPGDIPNPDASNFGFQARGQYAGEGDGNGVIEGVWENFTGSNAGTLEGAGETLVFWQDLATAKLIPGSFATVSETVVRNVYTIYLPYYFPSAVIGGNNYVYVWSGGYNNGDNANYFSISMNLVVGGPCPSCLTSSPGMTVMQASVIDKKIDDGSPQTGRVTAMYLNYPRAAWASGGGLSGTADTSATVGSSATCYDNGGNAGQQNYSLTQNNGNGVNCALSFRMQAGD